MSDLFNLKIKAAAIVLSNGEYVAVVGEALWVFRTDGQLLLRRDDIRYAGKITFLSGNKLLIGAETNASYRMISLPDGADVWSTPKFKPHCYGLPFAISPDGKYAYDVIDRRMKNYLVRLDLQTGTMKETPITGGYRSIGAIVCEEDGTPCLLQHHYNMDAPGGRVSENGIRCPQMGRFLAKDSINWKNTWQHKDQRISAFFLGNTSHILTNDLYVYKPETGESYFLLENDPQWVHPGFHEFACPSFCWFEENGRYLFLAYDNVHVAIDWKERKMAARYAGRSCEGKLMGSEYWMPTGEGVRCVPFPAIEDIPPRKPVFW